jgi:hypothetical protein
MPSFEPGWLAFPLGSLPGADPQAAWQAVLRYYPEIPGWPQLPKRHEREGMYAQFADGFPGVRFGPHVQVERSPDTASALERLYLAYLEDDLEYGRLDDVAASALALLLQERITLSPSLVALKGQVTGPISWGLTVVDQNQRPILYDEVLAEAVGKHLRLKASWQERELARFAPRTIMMLDEPYMASFGSAFVSLSRVQIVSLIEEVFAGLKGLKGIHCCGNTDWSILLSTSLDILSIDAYEYGASLTPYADDVTRFLDRGGIIAWGIAPTGASVESETVASLVEHLHDTMNLLVEKGVSLDKLLQAGLVTPSCGLGSHAPDLALRAMELTYAVSLEMRRRYGLAVPASTA